VAVPLLRGPEGTAGGVASLGGEPGGRDWRMYISLALISALGALITGGILVLVHQRELRTNQLEFNKLADDRVRAIQLAANSCVEVLHSVSDLYAASESVERDEFRQFASRAMQRHPEVMHLAWLPRTTHAQRQFAERDSGRFGRGFRITQLETNGTLAAAGERPEYFPAMIIEPFWPNRFSLGLDHYAEPARQAAMDLAWNNETPVATVRTRLVGRTPDGLDNHGVLVYLPVYLNRLPHGTVAQRRRNLAGFLVAVVQLDYLLKAALMPDALKEIEVILAEQPNDGSPAQLLRFNREANEGWKVVPQSLEEYKQQRRENISWEGVVDLAGQPWTVVCYPTRAFAAGRRSYSLWVILGLALVFTGFWVNYQRVIIQRANYVERLVTQRTRELKDEIASRARLETELQRERDLFHTLLDNLPDRIYFKDVQSRFLRVNHAMASLFGLQNPQDAAGKSDFDFFTIEHARPAFEDEQEIIRTGEPMIGRIEKETLPDGKASWAHTTKMPFRDKEGRIIGTFGISRDITSLREMTEQLQKANNELQQKNEALKAAQMQLIQAEKMQSVGRLAAGVAHEVKNPLAILGMGIDYLASSADKQDPVLLSVVEDMRAAIRRADNIILGLLDFSAPHEVKLEPVQVNDIVEQALVLTKHVQVGSLVLVERQLAAGLPPINADANKLIQVFVNLFMNACQAMADGGRLIVRSQTRQLRPEEVRMDAGSREAFRFRAGDPAVEVQVDDTGPGIPADKLQRIFDPFFTTKATGQGTGLGLAVTRNIMEMHGGRIEITNRPEGGARAALLLMVARAEPPPFNPVPL
jgi:PAS domain S-box-containing protein